MKKKFETFLLKNSFTIALPAMVVLAIFMILLLHFPIFDQIKNIDIFDNESVRNEYEEELTKLYEEGRTNLHVTVNDLYYTGFDYTVDDKVCGSYYYTMKQGQLHIYLIDIDDREQHIDSYVFDGKLIIDKASTEHIVTQLATSNGLSMEAAVNFCSKYVISELDYPRANIIFVYVFYAIPIIVSLFILIYTIVIWLKPYLHSQSKQLAIYGDINEVIDELNKELAEEDLYKKGNIYITSDYMIISHLTKTEVIKLDQIKYLSVNEIEKKNIFRKNITIYRLTISNPEVLFYEIDFSNLDTCEKIKSLIE